MFNLKNIFGRLIYGLIFLFKWQNNKKFQESLSQIDMNTDNIFFTDEVIINACATQAILSILLNRDDIDIGQVIRNFKKFTQDFAPDIKREKI